MTPLLSIVIANYNYGRFLEEAIQSIIAQDMGDKVELIICDGGSTDNSVDIIRKYACGLPPNVERHAWREFLEAEAKTPSSNQKEETNGERHAGPRNCDYGAAGGNFSDGIHQGFPAGLGCNALDDESCLRLFGTAHPIGPHGAFEHDSSAAIRAAGERIERVARENGVFLSDEMLRSIVKGHRKVRRSGESEVYLDAEKGKYIKLYDPFAKLGVRHGRADEVIYNIVAHNLIFPETRYAFVGVAHCANGIRFVLLQDEVVSIKTVDEKQVASFLESRLGLVKDGRYSFGNDYYSITDIGASSDNVLRDKNGELKFINPIVVFKRPADEVIAHLFANSQHTTHNLQLITWWCSEKDRGQSDAFNKGFSHAKGEYGCWLNADDVLMPGALKAVMNYINRSPKCEWLAGSSVFADSELKVKWCSRCVHVWRNGFSGFPMYSVNGPSSFFLIDNLEKVGGFDVSLRYTMDTDLWRRFAKAGISLQHIPDYVWCFRVHEESKTSHKFITGKGSDSFAFEGMSMNLRYGITPFRNKIGSSLNRLLRLVSGAYLRSYIDTHRYKDRSIDVIVR